MFKEKAMYENEQRLIDEALAKAQQEFTPMRRWQWIRDGWWFRSLSLDKYNEDRMEDEERRQELLAWRRVARDANTRLAVVRRILNGDECCIEFAKDEGAVP